MQLQDNNVIIQMDASVESTTRLTPVESSSEVRELTLILKANEFIAEAGQCIGVFAPGIHGQASHFRLYTLADLPERIDDQSVRVHICVRRCSYIDEYSGASYPGVASNYLCDLNPGDPLLIGGPFEAPFDFPEDEKSPTLILIGAGTGIAPFRAFVKRIYQRSPDFAGRILLFHGGRTGLELVYMNDIRDDFSMYMQKETFEAIQALSRRPHWTDAIDWYGAIAESRSEDLWTVMLDANTYVYVAGVKLIVDELDRMFARLAGSPEKWARRKAELVAGSRWTELVY